MNGFTLSTPLIFCVAFLGFGELLTSTFFPQRLQYIRENRYTVSENVPGFRGREFGREFNVPFNLNEVGERGKDFPYRKPEGTTRFMFLGDSFILSLQVPLEAYFVELLSARLNGASDSKVEILSRGVGGWDNVQQLIYLKNEGFRYQPDFVVVFFYVGNDINGNYNRWYVENLKDYVMREDLNLHYRKAEGVPLLKRLKEVLLQRSHFFNLIYYATNSARFRDWIRSVNRKLRVIEIPEREESYAQVSRREKIEKGWEITFHLMDLFKEYCKRKEIELIYILIPDNSQIYPQHFRDRFRKIQREYWGLRNAQPRLIRALEEKRISYFDLTPHLKEKAREEGSLFYFEENEHWTPVGHRGVADVLAPFFMEKVLGRRYQPSAARAAWEPARKELLLLKSKEVVQDVRVGQVKG